MMEKIFLSENTRKTICHGRCMSDHKMDGELIPHQKCRLCASFYMQIVIRNKYFVHTLYFECANFGLTHALKALIILAP